MKTMTWVVEFADEACGMVRYGTWECQATSKQEAMRKFNESVKNSGPGIFAIDAKEKK